MADCRFDQSEYETNLGDPSATELGPEDPVLGDDELAAAGLLVTLCSIAEEHYGLRVGECDAPGAPSRWGPVHKVHAPGSLHYLHRAADISGLEASMHQFCSWVARTHGSQITELIHNPGCSIKNGKDVPSTYWGEKTWQAHRNHVHLGI
jgi:hypothetical protein